ncbi:type VII secretion protein EccB [Streptacidiphilus jiangxiensis]|uniref:Type VII secretion protein EccB n=1 Tax=Streptacidiphilus jiangxiensis TaxID=235985 RepID=A0A1H7ZUC7_STRJI|nr:type VII secretion protein EccB [Streptacidiphilus jiangxiensis]SEM61089.1 type VII secretion protein EccB [Streptacidiphilus jiangxiensis]
MASRRDELSAYTFARKRTVAAFLRPMGGGSVEDAPRAVRAIMPSLVLGAVAVAGFGAYGMLRPSAPKDWQKANAVIVDKETTTRYVMLGGQLHPVLNMSSARLLLSNGSGVEYIDDSALNSPSVVHGPTVGIPYAPDSLPSATDAGAAKTWAACDRSSADLTVGVDQRLFVLGGSQAGPVSSAHLLPSTAALHVRTPDGATYLVDSSGVYHQLLPDKNDKDGRLLATAAFGVSVGMPQQVGTQWLKAFTEGSPIALPHALLPGFGHLYAGSDLAGNQYRIGDLLKVTDNGTTLHYVLLADGPHRISDFARRLVEAMHGSDSEYDANQFKLLDSNMVAPFAADLDWPTSQVSQANTGVANGPMAACAVYGGTMGQKGPQLGVWLGQDYPVSGAQASGTAGVYVTPGTGLLLQAVSGTAGGGGKVYLLTDTGLRYPLQMNSDGNPGAGASGGSAAGQSGQAGQAGAGAGSGQSDTPAARLGYGQVNPVPVPQGWVQLVPTGPSLTEDAAAQTQGS